ncbi:uncharacterized protein LOC21391650 [Morus notabilis]|uniref:uncharacterized protein LOC21391650 n=1 Tax=Morus notabilis TaxID=981085 RepID=UPI000CED5D9E|nr:uncharacterized protein LOC21391650 [Morus notabilis]
MTLMSSEESQEEEHCDLFFEVLLDLLSFSAASYSALARYPISVDKVSMDITEKFIMEQLNITNDAISASKRIHSHASEVLKVAHVVIDAVIRLCGVYAQAINWNISDANLEEKNSMDFEGFSAMNHVINITKYAIEVLHKMGIFAAKTGGSLVSILNVSWKGVVTLLQIGDGAFGVKMNAADILTTLVSLVNDSLKCTAEAWSSLKESVSTTEARRKFLPVKFYLINAVKVSSLYPCQAFAMHKKITLCVLMISTFKVSMSNEKHLKTACEVFTELLEKTSLDLLNSLLNSDQVKKSLKFEVLDSLFINKSFANPIPGNLNDLNKIPIMDGIFSESCELFSGARSVLLGQVELFLSFSRYSVDLEDVKLVITRKLGWFLDSLVDEELYSSVLVLQIPVLCGSGKNVELVWQPIYASLLNALKTLMVVVSSSDAWTEVESFLLENLFHPHFLCWEIVMELWCFLVRYAEPRIVSGIVDKFCSLLKFLASSESVLVPGSGMRKLARSISMLLSFGTPSMVDQVFKFIIDDDRSQMSSVVCLALFIEGFPLNLLSDKMKSIATQRILSDFFVFIESFDEKLINASNDGIFGVPVFALSASLQSLHINSSEIDVKTLRFLVSIIHSCRDSMDKLMKDQYLKLLSETLGIISNMKHLYASDEIEEVIFELENLFISGPAASDNELYKCKPNLALFMAGIAHVQLAETDKNSKFSAACELYHMMLRERHWALIHLALTAFGYFSARTTCDELWRFVPQNAALSYDILSGSEANEERFMSVFKTFLDEEIALDITASNSEELGMVAKEGRVLKEIFQKIMEIDVEKQSIEVDEEKQDSKKRKLPDGISEGMELLQSGLKVIVNGLSQWQQNQPESTELQHKFKTHCSRLEDEITRLVGLAGSNN